MLIEPNLMNGWKPLDYKKYKLIVGHSLSSCLTLCDPMHCSTPGSSVHGILQARILESVAISFSRGSSQPRDRTKVSQMAQYHLSHQGSHLASPL